MVRQIKPRIGDSLFSQSIDPFAWTGAIVSTHKFPQLKTGNTGIGPLKRTDWNLSTPPIKVLPLPFPKNQPCWRIDDSLSLNTDVFAQACSPFRHGAGIQYETLSTSLYIDCCLSGLHASGTYPLSLIDSRYWMKNEITISPSRVPQLVIFFVGENVPVVEIDIGNRHGMVGMNCLKKFVFTVAGESLRSRPSVPEEWRGRLRAKLERRKRTLFQTGNGNGEDVDDYGGVTTNRWPIEMMLSVRLFHAFN